MAVPFENRNFQKELEKKLQELQQQDVKHLLLHSCCAPCSSYVIEYLSRYFQITVFYYNPNISAEEEYRKRVLEQQRFIKEFRQSIRLILSKVIMSQGSFLIR